MKIIYLGTVLCIQYESKKVIFRFVPSHQDESKTAVPHPKGQAKKTKWVSSTEPDQTSDSQEESLFVVQNNTPFTLGLKQCWHGSFQFCTLM